MRNGYDWNLTMPGMGDGSLGMEPGIGGSMVPRKKNVENDGTRPTPAPGVAPGVAPFTGSPAIEKASPAPQPATSPAAAPAQPYVVGSGLNAANPNATPGNPFSGMKSAAGGQFGPDAGTRLDVGGIRSVLGGQPGQYDALAARLAADPGLYKQWQGIMGNDPASVAAALRSGDPDLVNIARQYAIRNTQDSRVALGPQGDMWRQVVAGTYTPSPAPSPFLSQPDLPVMGGTPSSPAPPVPRTLAPPSAPAVLDGATRFAGRPAIDVAPPPPVAPGPSPAAGPSVSPPVSPPGTVPGTPGTGDIRSSLLSTAMNTLRNPSAYDDALFQRQKELAKQSYDENTARLLRGASADLARRGVDFGRLAGGTMSDAYTQAQRGWNDILTQMLGQRAQTIGSDRASAFGQALGALTNEQNQGQQAFTNALDRARVQEALRQGADTSALNWTQLASGFGGAPGAYGALGGVGRDAADDSAVAGAGASGDANALSRYLAQLLGRTGGGSAASPGTGGGVDWGRLLQGVLLPDHTATG